MQNKRKINTLDTEKEIELESKKIKPNTIVSKPSICNIEFIDAPSTPQRGKIYKKEISQEKEYQDNIKNNCKQILFGMHRLLFLTRDGRIFKRQFHHDHFRMVQFKGKRNLKIKKMFSDEYVFVGLPTTGNELYFWKQNDRRHVTWGKLLITNPDQKITNAVENITHVSISSQFEGQILVCLIYNDRVYSMCNDNIAGWSNLMVYGSYFVSENFEIVELRDKKIVDIKILDVFVLALSSTGVVYEWGDYEYNRRPRQIESLKDKKIVQIEFVSPTISRALFLTNEGLIYEAYRDNENTFNNLYLDEEAYNNLQLYVVFKVNFLGVHLDGIYHADNIVFMETKNRTFYSAFGKTKPEYEPRLKNKKILGICIGDGRTTASLLTVPCVSTTLITQLKRRDFIDIKFQGLV